MVLIIHSKNIPATYLESITSLLDQFKVPSKVFEISKKNSSSFSLAKIKAVIIESNEACSKWVQAYLPTVPCVQIPHATSPEEGLKVLQKTPTSIPTLALNQAGATNSALFCISILAIHNKALSQTLDRYRKNQTQQVLKSPALVC